MPHTEQNGGSNGHSATTPLREKVQFKLNVSERLTLEFDPPTQPKAGRFGDQYMYWFAGNLVAWLDPPVHAQIVRMQPAIKAGDEIEITKREVRDGSKKRVNWEVVAIEPEPTWENHTAYDPDYAPDAKPTAPQAAAQPPRTIPQQTQPAADGSPDPNPLAQALIMAIDAIELASKHGERVHHWDEPLSLSEDSIVKLAITAYIQGQGGKQARV